MSTEIIKPSALPESKEVMADIQEMNPIKTKNGLLEIYRDWDCDGAIYMKNPKTIHRYKALIDKHPDSDEYGIFWAFSNKQFDEGLEKMKNRGLTKDGEKIYSIGAGGYGVKKELIDAFFNFYEERDRQIAKECDPQEVYLYEYNNHECMIAWEGDEAAYKIVAKIFGNEAEKIKRF